MNRFMLNAKRGAYLQPILSLFLIAILVISSSGCELGQTKLIDQAISEIDQTEQNIISESTSWRDELPKLVASMTALESKAKGDTLGILDSTTNQVQTLANQTIAFAASEASNLVAQAGVEFRCNGDFVKDSAVQALNYLIKSLQFWKTNKSQYTDYPKHQVCWLNPSVLNLYQSGGNWLIDSTSLSQKNIVFVYGYNFRAEALPKLILKDSNGNIVRNANLSASIVSPYQINMDFSTETFSDFQSGYTIGFDWPDQGQPSQINLVKEEPEHLSISDIQLSNFNPSSPVATQDNVSLSISLANTGGSPSGAVTVYWIPSPNDSWESSISIPSINPGVSRTVNFPDAYTFSQGGQFTTRVTLSNGDDQKSFVLTVAPAPHVAAPEKSLIGFPTTDTHYGKYIGGTGDNVPYGGMCNAGYHRSGTPVVSQIQTSGGASAWFNGWTDPNDESNCTIIVHYSIQASAPNTNANWIKVKIDIREVGN